MMIRTPLVRTALGALILLVAGPVAAQGTGANASATTLYSEASYCHQVAKAFKDSDLERRWSRTRAKYFPLIPEDQQLKLSGAARSKVESEAKTLAPASFRSQYERCKQSLAGAEAQAQAANESWAKEYNAQRDAQKSPFINRYAPPKYTAMELAGDMAGTRDLAAQEVLRDKARAWNAYCLVAAQALYAFSANNPGAFGLDPKRAEDARLLARIDGQRGQYRTTLLNGFKPEQQARAEAFANAQKENYRKGLDESKSRESEVVQFIKVQMFTCDSGFELAWGPTR
ncbi:MAG: hypothetical protein KJ017_04075 [Alphaproteobacteria bacterium]|nr:hypothetical protein [Alphaproteobacteria bacterium]